MPNISLAGICAPDIPWRSSRLPLRRVQCAYCTCVFFILFGRVWQQPHHAPIQHVARIVSAINLHSSQLHQYEGILWTKISIS